MLNAFLISCITLSMWQALQKFPAKSHSTVEIYYSPSAIFQVVLVVSFVSYLRIEAVNSEAFLEAFFKLALVSAKWVLQLTLSCEFTVFIK